MKMRLPPRRHRSHVDPARSHLYCLRPPPKDARRLFAEERRRAVLDTEDRPFPETDHRRLILFEELADAFFARFALVRRLRIGIEVVGVDLEGHQSECVER